MTQEGEISKRNRRGKNTTTATKLYEIDNNTYIADTPGFSTFDISEIASKDLYKYFREFKEYEKQCIEALRNGNLWVHRVRQIVSDLEEK